MNPSENLNLNRKGSGDGDPPVSFQLRSDEEGDDQISRNKLSSSSFGELDNDELDESIDDACSDDSRVYHKKLKKVNRAILHPKKNLILLSHMDAEISKSKLDQISFSIENKENRVEQPASKRRKYSSSSFSDEIGLDLSQMEQVVDAGDSNDDNDSKLSSNFKNCILKTMNEILRTNLQLNRKIDQIKEQNFYMTKRIKRLEQMVKIRAIKDQEVEDDVDLLSDLSEENMISKNCDDLKIDIKQEKIDNRSSELSKINETNKTNLESMNQQKLMSQSKRLADSVAKQSDLMRPSANTYHHRTQNFVLQPQQHSPYSYNYNGTGQQQHHHSHPDAYHFHQQYRYNTSSLHHHGSINVPNGSIQAYRPTQSSSSSNISYLSTNSSTSAQNPKTAAALAAAVAAAMAASTGQAEYSQESVEENEYDDSLEEETIGAYTQNDVGLINGQFSSIVPQHAPIRHIPSSIVDQLELSDDVERLVSRDVIKRCIRKAKHRGNFAANLAAELFSKEERITCNCTGTRGKRQLSPRRLQIVKEITFRMYNSHAVKQASNVSGGQQSAAALLQDFEEAWRKECITAIDAKNRSIGRDLIKNTSSSSIASSQQSISPTSISSTTPSNPPLSAPLASEVY